MSEQNKVNILGINVVRLEVEEAVNATLNLVTEPKVGMIYFLTAESSLLCETDETAANFVNCCDLVLPGDLHMEKVFCHRSEEDVKVSSEGDYAGDYMKSLFSVMDSNELSIYTVMDSEYTLTALQEYILTNYPGINLDGILVEKDSEGEFGRVVNDINACVPDIVFLCLPPELQIRFVRDFGSMMNTGLCICIESMQPWVQNETVEIPGIISSLKMEKMYLWLKKEQKLQKLITGSIFRKKAMTGNDEPQK